jgi:hypothetical protein
MCIGIPHIVVACAAKYDLAAIIGFNARFLCSIAHITKVVAATQYVAQELSSTHGSDAKSSSPGALLFAINTEQIKATTLKELAETVRAKGSPSSISRSCLIETTHRYKVLWRRVVG